MGLSCIALLFVAGTILHSIPAVLADCSAAQDPVISSYYTSHQSGQATYYGEYSSGGHCTLDPTPSPGTATGVFSTVAIATNIYGNSEACGMCINMTGTGTGSGANPLGAGKSYIVYVNNQCPSCADSGIDIGLSGDGAWGITWEAVPCPVTGNIQYLLQGANAYYIKLQIRNTLYPVAGVSIMQNNQWHPLTRTPDNFFEAGSTVTFPIAVPYSLQITSSSGSVVSDGVPSITNNGVVMTGNVQFSSCSVTSGSGNTASTASISPKVSTTGSPSKAGGVTTSPASAVRPSCLVLALFFLLAARFFVPL